MLEVLDLELPPSRRTSTRRSSPTRTAPPRRSSPRCASAGSRSSTCRPTSACATSATYERWYGEHPAPELIGDAVYGLPELYREQLRGAELVASPGCYPTAAILALAPLAAGLIADVVIDAKSGVSGAGRARDRDDALRLGRRERVALRRRRPPPHARDRAGARAAPVRRGPDVQLRAAPGAARPGRAGLLLRDAVATSTATSCARSSRTAYADEPFVEVAGAPPGVRDVRETNVCRIHAARDGAPASVLVFAAIDNLWKGTVVAGGPEPQPDARARRDGRGS